MTSQEKKKKKQQNKDMDAVLPRPSWWLFWFQRVPAPRETPDLGDRDATQRRWGPWTLSPLLTEV